jgi:hypothetical protein
VQKRVAYFHFLYIGGREKWFIAEYRLPEWEKAAFPPACGKKGLARA